MAESQTADQSERFETAFNRIHKALMKNVKGARSDKFTDLVYRGKSHGFIRYYEADLCQFAKLRNAIVHEKIKQDYYIAEPHIDIVEKIEKIAEEFERPPSALSIATKPVYYFYESDQLKDVLDVIKKHSHSIFPIYNEKEEYSWLLTASEIVKYLADHFDEDKRDLNRVKIKELFNPKHKKNIAFVSQHTTVFEIEDIYEEYQKRNKKLSCVVITRSGHLSEEPNGIITSWDLLGAEISE
ncbi:CBS domain-containing protein [Bacillus sp. 1P06AnD]|uniref:CBS domain-containing protein n=1 Tax=Bacillus sp. 1P06AnD TaxID=3132208 RepID=UPI00399FB021